MLPEPLTCPFCNAHVPAHPRPDPGGRLHCPRCGEPVPQRSTRGQADLNGTGPAPQTLPVASPPAKAWTNRSVARGVLGVMGLMALVGLSYALWTVDFRNQNHQRRLIVNVKKEVADTAGGWDPVGPAELRALGYLPTDTNVVGAVHVAEILQDPLGRKFLQPPRPAPLEWALARVEEWTGLKPEVLDHVVFGTKVGTDLPHLSLIVQTRHPYQQAEIARAKVVHGSRPGTYRNKPLYRLRINPVGDLLLWCADERTLVVLYRFDGTRPEDLNAVPETPRRGAEGLPAPLRRCLEKRLGKGTLVWLAGHLDQPEILTPLLTLSQVPFDVQQRVSTIRTFGAGLRFQQGVTLSADFHCTDGPAARQVTDFLGQQTRDRGSFKVVSSPSPAARSGVKEVSAIAGGPAVGVGPLSAAALVAGLVTGASTAPQGEANWVTLQVRAEPDAIRETLNHLSAFLPHVSRP